jgi:hypothetical protein
VSELVRWLVISEVDNQNRPRPGFGAALLFRGKALAFQVTRVVRESIRAEVLRYPIDTALLDKKVIAESRTLLWTEHETSERRLVAGKIHNLRLAIRRLNGVEVPGGAVFSFWKHVGRASRLKGYVAGRELREGCLIPSIGGGLCQLSNALYDAAVRAGFDIVERHPHTQVVAGSLAESDRDATVFWNYVDLRFKSARAFRIEIKLTTESLVVRFKGEPRRDRKRLALRTESISVFKQANELENCSTCGTQDCFRQLAAQTSASDVGRTAYLVDEYWPEFDRYINGTKRKTDLLGIPVDGRKLRRPNYAWTTSGFDVVKQCRLFTLSRSYQSRKLANQGAARQTALLATHEQLANRYASLLPYDVTHVTVMQSLLPFLWRGGHLGGRTFDVLMTKLPLAVLHTRLDEAFRLHSQSRTLQDFRAADWLVETEREALDQARQIIAPHTEIAALYPEKSVLIDWLIPSAAAPIKRVTGCTVKLVFPATNVGRNGIYELREAIAGLDVQLVIMGAVLEDQDFWNGLQVERLLKCEDWLANATAVVLPAFVEHKPRRLLEAVARGVPVVASNACGLKNVSGVITVRAGDVSSLRAEIQKVLSFGGFKLSGQDFFRL